VVGSWLISLTPDGIEACLARIRRRPMTYRSGQARNSTRRSIRTELRRSDCHARLWLPDFNGGEVIAELNRRSPFGVGEVAVFQSHDALEHLRDPIHSMKEIHRCLALQGWLLSQTPSTDGRGAFQDPTHVSFWNSNSFWYYTRADQSRCIICPHPVPGQTREELQFPM
jgi:SAM-dependent methyltransferase